MSFDKFKKEYIPLVKNFDCGNVVINNFLNSENALDFNPRHYLCFVIR